MFRQGIFAKIKKQIFRKQKQTEKKIPVKAMGTCKKEGKKKEKQGRN